MDAKAVYASLKKLRDDALARDMKDLAVSYGWSMIELGNETLARQQAELANLLSKRGA